MNSRYKEREREIGNQEEDYEKGVRRVLYT